MNCKICNNQSVPLFKKKVLHKYDVEYFKCEKCGFIQTEEPYWLGEAYKDPITITDTGLLSRNIYFSKLVSLFIDLYLNKNCTCVDFAGGYGVFTRLMRDNGFDFYWHDPFCQNLFALGFEWNAINNKKATLLTTFESFEHFANPHEEIEKMLALSPTILFSTILVPEPAPEPSAWWYYAFDQGQHISLYSKKSLEEMAKRHGLTLYTNGVNIHILTAHKINFFNFTLLKILQKMGLK
jgi:hypothetical protein